MTEQQLTHRHALESRAIDGKLTAERRGQTLGFILALTVIIGGGVLIAFDKDASGLTAIVSALAVMSPMRTVQMTLDQSVGTLILPGARAANG